MMERFFAAIGALGSYLAGLWLAFFVGGIVGALTYLVLSKSGLGLGPALFICLGVCMVGGWIYDWAKAQKNHNP
ncbi:MAG: hypothetical protein CBD47_05710 [Synechococcus sp. TMED187]|nr:MAG: hypothetical protein CBD47_05710 [Synechococcus sp. TMED187]